MNEEHKNMDHPQKKVKIRSDQSDTEKPEFHRILSKILPIFKKIQITNTVYPIFYFFMVYGITFLISIVLFQTLGSLKISFFLPENNEYVHFNLPMGDLVSVILLGGVFSFSALRAFELLRNNVDKNRKSYAQRLFVVVIYISFLILLIIGTVAHMVSNQLHEYIYEYELTQTITTGTPLGYLKTGIYLWDEIISHLFMALGFYGLLYVNVYMDLINDSPLSIKDWEVTHIIIGAILLGFGIAIGFIEGQCAMVLLFPAFILIILIAVVIKKNNFSFRKNPFAFYALILNLSFILSLIIYGILTGFRDNYPYFYQPSELDLLF